MDSYSNPIYNRIKKKSFTWKASSGKINYCLEFQIAKASLDEGEKADPLYSNDVIHFFVQLWSIFTVKSCHASYIILIAVVFHEWVLNSTRTISSQEVFLFFNWPLKECISDDYKLNVGLTVIFATYPHKLCAFLRSAPTRENNSLYLEWILVLA